MEDLKAGNVEIRTNAEVLRIEPGAVAIRQAGKEEQIDLIEGDALEVMHGLEGRMT